MFIHLDMDAFYVSVEIREKFGAEAMRRAGTIRVDYFRSRRRAR